MVKAAENWARANGFSRIYLDSGSVRKFYEKLEYGEVDEQDEVPKVYYGDKVSLLFKNLI